jgi:ubiquinone/menaquinone biosynthesis C-methylase UbiE
MAVGDMKKQIDKVRRAYDLTVAQFQEGVDVYATVPEEIRNLPGYTDITKNQNNNSNAPDIREYLAPRPGMRYLDAGCCANLANYRLDQWPSVYYGVDISPALVDAMKRFAEKHNIPTGGLHVADVARLPFDNELFDIATLIGVLEYCTLQHTEDILRELWRVLKQGAKMALDFPDLEHPYVNTMFRLEEFLGRPNIPKERKSVETLLKRRYTIDRVFDSLVMIKYFVRVEK